MITRQSLKNRPTFRNAPRRKVHKVGRHIEIVTKGGVVIERRVWDGSTWIAVKSERSLEYALLREILRLKSNMRALSKTYGWDKKVVAKKSAHKTATRVTRKAKKG